LLPARSSFLCAQAKRYSGQEAEAAALHVFLGTLRQVAKDAQQATGSSSRSSRSSSSSSGGSSVGGGALVTAAQLAAWSAFKGATARTYGSVAEECGALGLFLAATASATVSASASASHARAVLRPKLLPGSMPTADELRDYGAYKRQHGLSYDGDPKAEAESLHVWFKARVAAAAGGAGRAEPQLAAAPSRRDGALDAPPTPVRALAQRATLT
jgi:hypothetical protein